MNLQRLEEILNRLPQLTVGIVGDFFLDRYLDLDAGLTEQSLETGLDAYQVVRIRNYPGAGGTVASNLRALGVGQVMPFTVIGADEHGFALRKELVGLGVSCEFILESRERLTPTYTKPLLFETHETAGRELNRLDVKNRTPLPKELESSITGALADNWDRLDALIVADQVEEPDSGVVTGRARELLARLGEHDPSTAILVDSRKRIGEYGNVIIKPNENEARRLLGHEGDDGATIDACELLQLGRQLEARTRRPVCVTRGEKGLCLIHNGEGWQIPAFPVEQPIDIVGAGDSTTAGIVSSLAAGADLTEAGTIGCLVASITIQQVGVTGTASPEAVRERFKEYVGKGLSPGKIETRETIS